MKITLTKNPKQKPDFSNLGFGKYFTDHMLLMEYKDGAWGEIEIRPFEPFAMSPASNVLHYAQGIFEGAKAYKNDKGEITVFRIDDIFTRMNNSAKRLCMLSHTLLMRIVLHPALPLCTMVTAVDGAKCIPVHHW